MPEHQPNRNDLPRQAFRRSDEASSEPGGFASNVGPPCEPFFDAKPHDETQWLTDEERRDREQADLEEARIAKEVFEEIARGQNGQGGQAGQPGRTMPEREPISQGGRPRVLDPVLKGKVCSFVQMGLSYRQAAAEIGVAQSTISREIQRDPVFADQIDLAKRRGENQPYLQIIRAAQHSWRAASWLIRHKEYRKAKREESEGLRTKD